LTAGKPPAPQGGKPKLELIITKEPIKPAAGKPRKKPELKLVKPEPEAPGPTKPRREAAVAQKPKPAEQPVEIPQQQPMKIAVGQTHAPGQPTGIRQNVVTMGGRGPRVIASTEGGKASRQLSFPFQQTKPSAGGKPRVSSGVAKQAPFLKVVGKKPPSSPGVKPKQPKGKKPVSEREPTPREKYRKQEQQRRLEKRPNKKLEQPTNDDLAAYRKELGVPEGNTVAVSRTNVKGIEHLEFKGASPAVRKKAGLPDLDQIGPKRDIKSPAALESGTRHAEEDLIFQFMRAVKKAKLSPGQVKGELRIHQSNPRGVCPNCVQGITNPAADPGIFLQLSRRFPELVIKVTTQRVPGITRPNAKFSFTLKGGKYIE
jgi:hypothetical protein